MTGSVPVPTQRSGSTNRERSFVKVAPKTTSSPSLSVSTEGWSFDGSHSSVTLDRGTFSTPDMPAVAFLLNEDTFKPLLFWEIVGKDISVLPSWDVHTVLFSGISSISLLWRIVISNDMFPIKFSWVPATAPVIFCTASAFISRFSVSAGAIPTNTLSAIATAITTEIARVCFGCLPNFSCFLIFIPPILFLTVALILISLR